MTQPYYQQNQETIYYQDETGLTVTSTKIIFGPKLLFLNTLSSIRIVEIPPKKVYPSILMSVGILIFLTVLPQFSTNLPNAAAGVTIATICIIISIIWFILEKPYYSLKLGGNMGEMDLIISRDKDYLDLIIFAINQAIQKLNR